MTFEDFAAEAFQRHRTTPDAVADVLRKAILQGVLEGGQPLKQDDLASRFGVSRVPVREALRQLEAEGLVVLQPHRGAVVASLTPKEVAEIYEIRFVLEPQALRWAWPHLTPEDLVRASAVLDAADKAILAALRGETSPEFDARWGELNWEFHSALYRPGGRARVLDMLRQQHALVERYLRIQTRERQAEALGGPPLPIGRDTSLREHHEILNACRDGDLPRAVKVLEDHIALAGEHLVSFLEDRAERLAPPAKR